MCERAAKACAYMRLRSWIASTTMPLPTAISRISLATRPRSDGRALAVQQAERIQGREPSLGLAAQAESPSGGSQFVGR